MATSKSKKNSSRANVKRAKHPEKARIIVTLDLAKGDVVKVETLDTKGERQEISEKEFAELIGGDETADIEAALKEAYTAGVEDGSDDSGDGNLDEDEEAMLRGAEAMRFLRRGARRLVLVRALKRGGARKHAASNHNGAGTAH